VSGIELADFLKGNFCQRMGRRGVNGAHPVLQAAGAGTRGVHRREISRALARVRDEKESDTRQ